MNKSDQPLVSIVVSTYNGEQFIDEQLQSLVDQDYPNIEIIITDDVSNDNTWNILNRWKSNYPDIISVFQNEKNMGWSLNFGNGVTKANGDYIAWCDQDDKWMLNKVSAMVATFQKQEDATLVYHDAYVFKDNGEILPREDAKFKWAMFQGSDPVTLFWHCRILGHRMMFPSKLKSFILPPSELSYDWWVQVFAASYGKVYFLDEKLVAQRKHNNNATGENDINRSGERLVTRLEHLKKFQQFAKFMKDKDRSILDTMTSIMVKHVHGQFDWSLFFFALRYRYRLYDFLVGGNSLSREVFRWRLARAWAKNW